MPINLLEGYSQGGPYQERGMRRNLLAGVDIAKALEAPIPDLVPQQLSFKQKLMKMMGESGQRQMELPGQNTEVLRGAVNEVDQVLGGTADAAVELGAGVAGWMGGVVPAVGSLIGEKLKGGDAAGAYDTAMEKYSGIISEGIKAPYYAAFPDREKYAKYGRTAAGLAGEGIDLALSSARKLANVEGDWYKWAGLKPLEETHPAAAKLGGLATELMAFKAAHVGAKGAARGYRRLAKRFDKALRKKPKDLTAEDVKVIDQVDAEMAEAVRTGEAPERLLLEYKPELAKDFKLGRVTEETVRRPIRGQGPAEPQKLLPLQGGEPGRGIDLAPPGTPKVEPPYVQNLNKGEVRTKLNRSERAGERALGSKIKYDGTMEQGEGMAPWHGYTFLDGPAEGGSFTVIKDGRVLKADIVKAGQDILKQRKLKEVISEQKPVEVADNPLAAKDLIAESKAEVIPLERKPSKIGKTEITPEQIKNVSPEQVKAKIGEIMPEVQGFIDKGVGDGVAIRNKINDAMDGMDLGEGADVVFHVEQLMGKINKRIKEATGAKETGKITKEVSQEKRVEGEEGRQVRVRDVEETRVETLKPGEVTRLITDTPNVRRIRKDLIDTFGEEPKRGRQIPETLIKTHEELNTGYERGEIIATYNIPTKVGEKLSDHYIEVVGGDKRGSVKRAEELIEKHSLDETVAHVSHTITYADAGHEWALSRLKGWENPVTPKQIGNSLALIKKRHEVLKGKLEDRLKTQEKLEMEVDEVIKPTAKEAFQNEDLMSEFLDQREQHTGRKATKESNEKLEKIGEEYVDLYDPDLVNYGAKGFVKDLVDIFRGDETGTVGVGISKGSFMPITPEKIQKLYRMWKKAKDKGRELGEYLREAIPKLPEDQLKELEKFIEDHFVERKPLDVSEQGKILVEGKQRKWHKGKPDERIVKEPDYPTEWYDNWQTMKPVKFLKSVGGHYGTTARAFFEQAKWLGEEVYYPWRKAYKETKVRKRNFRDQVIKPLKKLVPERSSRKKIRDHSIVQQLYKRDAEGKILVEDGVKVLKENAKEFMAENRIKAIPKLNEVELKVYNELRRQFDILYEEINTMRANNGLTPFKKVHDYFTFLRAIKAFDRIGLQRKIDLSGERQVPEGMTDPRLIEEFKSKTPDYIMAEFARMKELPFQFKHARVKNRKYRIKDEPFDIIETYADRAYDHIAISPIVAKVKAMTKPVPKHMQKITKGGNIGKELFNPLRRGPNINAAEYLVEWSHKISGVPMRYEMPPRIRQGLNKLNSNLAAAIIGFSARAVFIQPLALIGTYSNIGLRYTVQGILSVPNPRKYRMARQKSDVLYTRTPDAIIADHLGKIGELRISEFPKIAKQISFKGLEVFDTLTAHATWNGAYAQAKAGRVPHNRGKMSEAEAIRYADDVVIRTQGSGAPGEIAPIQFTSLGKTMTMFQTFVINNWNFLAHDVLSLGPNTTINQALPKMFRYMFAATAANFIFEDVAGMKSPLGRPVKALIDGVQDNNNAFDIAMDVAGELIEPVSVLGGARYGSHILGPLVQRIGDVTTGGKYGMTPKKEIGLAIDKGRFPDKTIQLAGDLLGVPGTGQAAKSYRAAKRGESPWGIVAGTYSKNKGTRLGRRARRAKRSKAD